jgi:hypothetical protein
MAGGRIQLVGLTKRFTDIAVDRIDRPSTAASSSPPVHAFLAPDALRVLGGAARDTPVAAEGDQLPAR